MNIWQYNYQKREHLSNKLFELEEEFKKNSENLENQDAQVANAALAEVQRLDPLIKEVEKKLNYCNKIIDTCQNEEQYRLQKEKWVDDDMRKDEKELQKQNDRIEKANSKFNKSIMQKLPKAYKTHYDDLQQMRKLEKGAFATEEAWEYHERLMKEKELILEYGYQNVKTMIVQISRFMSISIF